MLCHERQVAKSKGPCDEVGEQLGAGRGLARAFANRGQQVSVTFACGIPVSVYALSTPHQLSVANCLLLLFTARSELLSPSHTFTLGFPYMLFIFEYLYLL